MLSNLVQRLNKSFTSSKSSSPDKSPNKPDNDKTPPQKICSLCKGAGCCYLCENDDGWGNMVYCSNEEENHIIHQACDNVTPEILRYIDQYYCPQCRKDCKFQVTFFPKVSQNKQKEIRNLLNIPEPIVSKVPKKSKPLPKKGKKNLKKSKKPKKTSSLNLNHETEIIAQLMESVLQKVTNNLEVNNSLEVSDKTPSVGYNIPDVSSTPSEVRDCPLKVNSFAFEVNNVPLDLNSAPLEVRDPPPDVNSAPLEMKDPPSDKNSAPLDVNDLPLDVTPEKSNSFGKDTYQTNSEEDSSSGESSDNDSFRELFPGQKSKKDSMSSEKSVNLSKKSISLEELSVIEGNHDLDKQVLNEIKKTSRTASEEELLHVSFTDKSVNLPTKSFSPDNSSTSNQTSISYFQDIEERTKLINLVNLLTEKLKTEHEEKNNLKDIVNGQENEIRTLQRTNLKFELELEEAEAVIRRTGLELEEMKEKFVSLDKVYKELTFLNITPNERFEHHPIEVYELYKKESILSQKKSIQIKCLLNDNKSLRNNILEVKNENADLRFKVRNLIEEDIDKKILNFTMEENRRLELKIKIQRDRNINLGLECKEQMNKTYELEQKNESFKEKIETLEKNVKNNSLISAGKGEKDWETISIDSEPEVSIAQSSQKTSSPKQKESIEFQVKKALKEILIAEKNLPEGNVSYLTSILPLIPELDDVNTAKNTNSSNIQSSSVKNSSNIQSSSVKTGQNNFQKRSICKFYLENRCIFGYKCRNIHSQRPSQNQNYIPPWNPRIFPHGVSESQNQASFNPRLQQHPNPIYSVTGYGNNLGGKSLGYWSVPPIPVDKTRFSQLSELSLDGNNFPLLH